MCYQLLNCKENVYVYRRWISALCQLGRLMLHRMFLQLVGQQWGPVHYLMVQHRSSRWSSTDPLDGPAQIVSMVQHRSFRWSSTDLLNGPAQIFSTMPYPVLG